MAIRNVRDNNPGNIRIGIAWQGLMPPTDMNDEQMAERSFCVFKSPEWGFRAMAVILMGYERHHHLHTIRDYVSTWAPPSENDTKAYADDVAQECGVGPDDSYDLANRDHLAKLCKAMTRHEGAGWHFEDKDLDAGVALAEGTAAVLV